MSSKNPLSWKQSQQSVADYLEQHGFSIRQEVTLKGGGRVDIVAMKKIPSGFYHFLIEVKDWQKVTRKNESDFCRQIIDYIVHYAYETLRKKPTEGLWERKEAEIKDRFFGVLCLVKDAHFSYRQISHHFIAKHPQIRGIPFREQIGERIELFVARVDFLVKVFEQAGCPLFKESKIEDWLKKE